jgi:hypothetical protein
MALYKSTALKTKIIIPEIRLIQTRFFSINLGLSLPAKNTFVKSDSSTNPRQVPKTTNLY